jgi:hypothetical protein
MNHERRLSMFPLLKAQSLPRALAFLFLISTPAAVHAVSLFKAARSFPVGLDPNAVAAGDRTGTGYRTW